MIQDIESNYQSNLAGQFNQRIHNPYHENVSNDIMPIQAYNLEDENIQIEQGIQEDDRILN